MDISYQYLIALANSQIYSKFIGIQIVSVNVSETGPCKS